MKLGEMSLIQKLGWVYAGLFVFVVSLGYIPGFTNEQDQLFGLFVIDLYDDLLHLGSGIWAAAAAWHSTQAATFYFKLFGVIYGMDGVVGLIFGQAYLDGGIFLYGITDLPFMIRFGANIPHILIGGTAVFIGFVLSRKVTSEATTGA